MKKEEQEYSFMKELIPYCAGALLLIVAVYLYLLLTAPEQNLLPEVYGVM